MGKIAAALEKSGQKLKSAPTRKQSPAQGVPAVKTREHPVSPEEPISVSGRMDRSLVTIFRQDTFAVEQFKLLKTHLLLENGDKPRRLIMVTSALPGEGKSFVAANLAVSLAQNIKEHVLLIDCDLRRPAIHKIFGIGEAPGLSGYLQEDGADLQPFLVKTDQPKLTVLPAGRSPENPVELLASDKMTALLQDVKQRYSDRFVILDSPPPHLTAEANALARKTDTILLVIKQNGADRGIIAKLVEGVGKEKIGGVVFNRFEIPKIANLGYGKYGKYGNYHSYYK